MKPFLILILIACAMTAQAQSFPTSRTISTPYGNATYWSPGQPFYVSSGNGGFSPKLDYTIVFEGDSTLTVRTAVQVLDSPQYMNVKIKKKEIKVFPADTREVYRITPEGYKLGGIPADSCWLFHVIRGKIKGYSSIAFESYDYLVAIQQGEDGKIVPFTLDNLKAMIGDTQDPKLQKMLKKENKIAALRHYNMPPSKPR